MPGATGHAAGLACKHVGRVYGLAVGLGASGSLAIVGPSGVGGGGSGGACVGVVHCPGAALLCWLLLGVEGHHWGAIGSGHLGGLLLCGGGGGGDSVGDGDGRAGASEARSGTSAGDSSSSLGTSPRGDVIVDCGRRIGESADQLGKAAWGGGGGDGAAAGAGGIHQGHGTRG